VSFSASLGVDRMEFIAQLTSNVTRFRLPSSRRTRAHLGIQFFSDVICHRSQTCSFQAQFG
jgi:hypothetical protein